MKHLFLSFSLLAGLTSACTNSGMRPADFSPKASGVPETLAGPQLKVTLAQTAAPTGGVSTSIPAFSLYFDSAKGEISNHCSSSGKACVCRFNWAENNTAGGSTTEIQHNVRTAISAVQPNLVSCPAPSVYATEIGDNTQIKISVEPASSNSEVFSTNQFAFTKATNSPVSGSFQDALGRAFLDVYRYTCYELNTIAAGVGNKVGQPIPNPTGGAEYRNPIYSTSFCTSDGGNIQCTASAGTQFTANSFYRNLFIRSTDVGGINSESAYYKCPVVTESLRGGGQSYWPLDSSFALALNKSQEYPIGVDAYSKIYIPGDPNIANSTGCNPTSGSGNSSSTNPLVKSCLGWALRPNADGACPTVQTSNGTLPTFRLRRFTAIFPVRFSAKGDMIQQPQSVDTVYVVDRPVKYTGYDPVNPKTMLGPKPCPVSILDHKGVLTDQTGATANSCQATAGGAWIKYYSTNNSGWNGKNVDGLAFPYRDTPGLTQNNMANTQFVVMSTDKTKFHLKSNPSITIKNYIRPVTAWAPHYEEDMEFRACAPLASQVVDPPLQLSRATATAPYTGWCAKAFPNFNPVASQVTTAETLGCNSTKPAIAGALKRTAATNSANWKNFPLVGFEADTQPVIIGDSSYRCQITKPSTSSAVYPTDGCCKSTTPAANYITGGSALTKHFEPVNGVYTCHSPYE